MNQDNTLTLSESTGYDSVIALALDDLTSAHSKRAYRKSLDEFIAWYIAQGRPGLIKATVNRYKAHLIDLRLSPATINQKLSAIRKLAREAAASGFLDQSHANGIVGAKGVKAAGVRAGNWLTQAQAQTLLNAPDTSTLKGLRDRAILALMLGGGLRRSEVAELTFDKIQQREGRWVIVDLKGKGNRVRTIPIPPWCKVAIDQWAEAGGIDSVRVFRGVYRGGRSIQPDSTGITPQVVYDVVSEYAGKLGFGLAAHDLRRTFAKLAHKGGSGIDQIQLTLGHASIKTTERYLGVNQDLTDAPCDHLGIRID